MKKIFIFIIITIFSSSTILAQKSFEDIFLEATDLVGQTFEITGNKKFYSEIAKRFISNGHLAFHKLMINDKIAAMHFGYKYRGRFYYFKPTFNMDFKRFSVGRILMLELIKLSCEEDIDIFDFMYITRKLIYL